MTTTPRQWIDNTSPIAITNSCSTLKIIPVQVIETLWKAWWDSIVATLLTPKKAGILLQAIEALSKPQDVESDETLDDFSTLEELIPFIQHAHKIPNIGYWQDKTDQSIGKMIHIIRNALWSNEIQELIAAILDNDKFIDLANKSEGIWEATWRRIIMGIILHTSLSKKSYKSLKDIHPPEQLNTTERKTRAYPVVLSLNRTDFRMDLYRKVMEKLGQKDILKRG